jgi:hypothetical protein
MLAIKMAAQRVKRMESARILLQKGFIVAGASGLDLLVEKRCFTKGSRSLTKVSEASIIEVEIFYDANAKVLNGLPPLVIRVLELNG